MDGSSAAGVLSTAGVIAEDTASGPASAAASPVSAAPAATAVAASSATEAAAVIAAARAALFLRSTRREFCAAPVSGRPTGPGCRDKCREILRPAAGGLDSAGVIAMDAASEPASAAAIYSAASVADSIAAASVAIHAAETIASEQTPPPPPLPRPTPLPCCARRSAVRPPPSALQRRRGQSGLPPPSRPPTGWRPTARLRSGGRSPRSCASPS